MSGATMSKKKHDVPEELLASVLKTFRTTSALLNQPFSPDCRSDL